jgi:hypothetical protein
MQLPEAMQHCALAGMPGDLEAYAGDLATVASGP